MAINEIFDAALTVPVAPFTFLTVAVVVYWLLVMVGGSAPEPHDGIAGRLRSALGLSGIPLNIVGSSLIVLAWVGSLAGTLASSDGGTGSSPGPLASAGIAGSAIAAAVLGTSLLARPIRRALLRRSAGDPARLVGSVCVVRTGAVGPDSGQGEVTGADGSPVVIEIRHDGADALRPGNTALIHAYDAGHEVFWVTAFDPRLGTAR